MARDGSGCRPRFARLAASPLARACTPLTKSEEKERLFAVYHVHKATASSAIIFVRMFPGGFSSLQHLPYCLPINFVFPHTSLKAKTHIKAILGIEPVSCFLLQRIVRMDMNWNLKMLVQVLVLCCRKITYNYPPKGRWIVVLIYRGTKRPGIYLALFTDPEG